MNFASVPRKKVEEGTLEGEGYDRVREGRR